MKATYIDHMGTDLSVVNAARVSFGKRSNWKWTELDDPYLSKEDRGLIRFLARGCTTKDWEGLLHEAMASGFDGEDNEVEAILRYVKRMPDHWTPFGHTAITIHVKAPIFVARQLGKHQVGFVWNEVSRRYVDDTPEFYRPEEWRKAAANVKQGSSDETTSWGTASYKDLLDRSLGLYEDMLEMDICPEQARMVLPQSMMTEWYWTGNLYGFANVFIQRTDSHAQRETQEIAQQIGEIIEPLFPVAWEALTT